MPRYRSPLNRGCACLVGRGAAVVFRAPGRPFPRVAVMVMFFVAAIPPVLSIAFGHC